MKLFKRTSSLLKRLTSLIKKIRRGEMALGASAVRKRLADLKKFNVNNAAMRKFEAYRQLFKKKYGKDVFDRHLTGKQKAEATELFNMFLADQTTDINLIRNKYMNLKDDNLVEDVMFVEDMAKEIDIVQNRAIAKEIYDVLGSPTVRDVWQNFKSNKEDRENVALMKKAIMNTTKSIESGELPKGFIETIKESFKKLIQGDKYTEEDVNKFTSQQRKDAVLSEYKRLKRMGTGDYL